MNLLQNFHLAVIEYLYFGRRASLCKRLLLDSNRKLSIVMAVLTTFNLRNAFWKIRAISPFKVTDFGTNRKLIYDFLLVINTNLPPILHCFGDTAFQIQ